MIAPLRFTTVPATSLFLMRPSLFRPPPCPFILPLQSSSSCLHLLFSSRKAPANRTGKPNSPSFHRNKPVPSFLPPLPPVSKVFLSLLSLCPILHPPHTHTYTLPTITTATTHTHTHSSFSAPLPLPLSLVLVVTRLYCTIVLVSAHFRRLLLTKASGTRSLVPPAMPALTCPHTSKENVSSLKKTHSNTQTSKKDELQRIYLDLFSREVFLP